MINSNFNLNDVVGETFEDLSISEMVQVQGSGDVSAETSLPCLYSMYYATLSSKKVKISSKPGDLDDIFVF